MIVVVWMKRSDDEEDEDDYEIDITGMNVSPEILAMLGASEEVIRSKKEEISEIEWVAPENTGLEHSEAIASYDQVNLGTGRKEDGSTVQRVFKQVGEFDSPCAEGSPQPPVKTLNVLKNTEGLQKVPAREISKLPVEEDQDNASHSDETSSSGSWDEISLINGRPWWIIDSDDELEEGTLTAMSPNLLEMLGKAELAPKTKEGDRAAPGTAEWTPPANCGLGNSKPIVTLPSFSVGKTKDFQVEEHRGSGGKRGSEGDDDGSSGWNSDDEEGEWDYKEVDDEDYRLHWQTNISANLMQELGGDENKALETVRKSFNIKTFDWKPPSAPGLANSKPLAAKEDLTLLVPIPKEG
ncbi:unnamed protein product [Discosporangium mesarthrocarpum]